MLFGRRPVAGGTVAVGNRSMHDCPFPHLWMTSGGNARRPYPDRRQQQGKYREEDKREFEGGHVALY